MVLLCSVCVSDPGPGFTTSLVMVLLCSEHNNTITSDVVNPGPGSSTQTEHNNTITSDVVNPGPGSGTQTEHNNTMTSDVVNPG
jgi:hypothetical protein